MPPAEIAKPSAGQVSPADVDRKGAEWVLGQSGKVTVSVAGRDRYVTNASQLPGEPFRVVGIDLGNAKFVNDDTLVNVKDLIACRNINLEGTNISDDGLKHLKNLDLLAGVRVHFTTVTGVGFKYLSGTSGLKYVDAFFTPFTDEGLEVLKAFPSLEWLYVVSDQMTDAGLSHLRDMKRLTGLHIGGAKITIRGIEHLAEAPLLERLSIDRFTDDDQFKELTRLVRLKGLDLYGSRITDKGLEPIRALRDLDSFSLQTSPLITDRGLAILLDLPKLRNLNLKGIAVTDSGLKTLQKIGSLRSLDISGTKVTAAGVTRFADAVPNCKVTMSPEVQKDLDALRAKEGAAGGTGGSSTSAIPGSDQSLVGKPPVPPAVAAREFTNAIGMRFVLIPPGSFLMGSPPGEKGHQGNELQHQVTLTKGFYLGVHEVTRGQFARFVQATGYRTQAEIMGGGRFWTGSGWNTDPHVNWRTPGFEQSDDHPVVCISWNDAVAYGAWLSAQDRNGRRYRLPTEAEWEYACRAGTATAYCSGDGQDALKNVGWCSYDGKWNSAGRTISVGQFQANGWGLCDMHGNAYEWCQDGFGEYPKGDQVDPEGNTRGSARVLRGGCWGRDPQNCRSASRIGHGPDARDHHLGFRLAAGGTGNFAIPGTLYLPPKKAALPRHNSR